MNGSLKCGPTCNQRKFSVLFHGDVPPIMQNPEPCGTAGSLLSCEYTTIESGTCQGRLSRPRCEATVTGASGLYEDIYCHRAHLTSPTLFRNWNLSSGQFERTRSHVFVWLFFALLKGTRRAGIENKVLRRILVVRIGSAIEFFNSLLTKGQPEYFCAAFE